MRIIISIPHRSFVAQAKYMLPFFYKKKMKRFNSCGMCGLNNVKTGKCRYERKFVSEVVGMSY